MQTVLRKWGNSLALRLPQHVTSALQITDGSTMSVSVVDGTLVLRPAKPRYTLDELLQDHMATRNHKETGWSAVIGKEES